MTKVTEREGIVFPGLLSAMAPQNWVMPNSEVRGVIGQGSKIIRFTPR